MGGTPHRPLGQRRWREELPSQEILWVTEGNTKLVLLLNGQTYEKVVKSSKRLPKIKQPYTMTFFSSLIHFHVLF